MYTLNGGEVINALVFGPNSNCHWTVSQDMGESTQHLNIYKIILYQSLALSLSPSLPPLFIVVVFFISQDLESKSLVDEIFVDCLSTNGPVECMSLTWNGQTLFAGYTDNLIR